MRALHPRSRSAFGNRQYSAHYCMMRPVPGLRWDWVLRCSRSHEQQKPHEQPRFCFRTTDESCVAWATIIRNEFFDAVGVELLLVRW